VTSFQGVDHVGVGVSDADEAIEFYGRHVGFDRVLFDHTGELPGLETVAGRAPRARVAMLESGSATPIGPGRVKLVQVLDGDGPPAPPAGQAWGEVGVCEICLHVRGVQEVHDRLVAAGSASLMEPTSADVPPTGVTLAQPGDSMRFTFAELLSTKVPEIFNPAVNGEPGQPLPNGPGLIFGGTCTVTAT